jgi:hypothetical protein
MKKFLKLIKWKDRYDNWDWDEVISDVIVIVTTILISIVIYINA